METVAPNMGTTGEGGVYPALIDLNVCHYQLVVDLTVSDGDI